MVPFITVALNTQYILRYLYICSASRIHKWNWFTYLCDHKRYESRGLSKYNVLNLIS